MKTPWILVVLVAVLSAAATAAALELLRPERRPEARRPASVRPPEPLRDAVPELERAPLPTPDDGPTDLEARLAELERRLAALEQGAARRAAERGARDLVPPEASAERDALQDLVLAWVAEEREARAREAALAGEEKVRQSREFDARYQAHMLALQYELEGWQEDELAELYLEVREREAQITDSIDPAVDDPELVEARFLEFDEWVDQREREVMQRIAPDVYQDIYGDE